MIKKHKRRNSKGGEAGFTMVELIIVIILTSILGMFLFNVLGHSLLAQREMQVRKEHSDDAVLALDKISRELRQAIKPIHKFGGTELGFQKLVWSGNLYVLYAKIGQNVLRYEIASTGDNDNDYGNVTSQPSSIAAENVTTFSPDVVGSDRGDLSLRFIGEISDRQTSVYIRN